MPVESICGAAPTGADPDALARFYVEAPALRFDRLGVRGIRPPHGEGCGIDASFSDPDDDRCDIAELAYEFGSGGPRRRMTVHWTGNHVDRRRPQGAPHRPKSRADTALLRTRDRRMRR